MKNKTIFTAFIILSMLSFSSLALANPVEILTSSTAATIARWFFGIAAVVMGVSLVASFVNENSEGAGKKIMGLIVLIGLAAQYKSVAEGFASLF